MVLNMVGTVTLSLDLRLTIYNFGMETVFISLKQENGDGGQIWEPFLET